MPNDQTMLESPIPDHITMEQTTGGLLFAYRWFSPAFIFIALFALFWDGFLVFWYTVATTQDAPLIMLLFPIIHVLIGIGLTYFALAGFYNRTLLLVGEGKISIQHVPLPWPGNKVLQSSDLIQLYSEERVIRTRNGTQMKYKLNAITRENKKITLMSNLTAPDQVRFLERKLEEHLGITDVPVEGEMPR